VKFELWNERASRMITVSTGIAVFQITMTELLSDSSLAPSRLTTVNSSISADATARPVRFSVPLLCSITRWALAQLVLLRYWMLASTSIGAIVTACSHAAQPAVKPARVPNAKYGNRAVPPATG